MSSAEVSIQLDEPDKGYYEPGDEVTGTVFVEVSQDCTCSNFEIRFYWATSGKGAQDHGEVETRRLDVEGEWQEGDLFSREFSFEPSPGPYTYEGDLINVKWYAEVDADIDWGVDSNTSDSFRLRPGSGADTYVAGHSFPPESDTETNTTDRMVNTTWIVGSSFIVLVGLSCLYASYLFVSIKLTATLLFGVFGVLGLLFGGYFLYQNARNIFARQQIGDVQWEVKPSALPPGENIDVTVKFEPRSGGQMNKLCLELVGKEFVDYRVKDPGDSTDDWGTSVNVFSQVEICPEEFEDKKVLSNKSYSVSEALPVPGEAPFSFEAEHNRVRWIVRCYIDIEGWPDWKDETHVNVMPRC
ncbi:MAG: hypothetical protein ABEJ65_12905 [bacterium]